MKLTTNDLLDRMDSLFVESYLSLQDRHFDEDYWDGVQGKLGFVLNHRIGAESVRQRIGVYPRQMIEFLDSVRYPHDGDCSIGEELDSCNYICALPTTRDIGPHCWADYGSEGEDCDDRGSDEKIGLCDYHYTKITGRAE